MLPEVLEYHRWLYRARDPFHRGLVTLIHPWECGLDTTPPWMGALARMTEPWWMRVALRLHLARWVRFCRRDTRFVPAAQRSSDDDGLRMLVLIRRARRHSFDLRRMPPADSVLIEDVGFNALLIVANRALEWIAFELGASTEAELQQCFHRSEDALEELWDQPSGQYYSRNATTGELLTESTIATFLPLWAGVPTPAQAKRLAKQLREPGFWPAFPVPSVPTDAPQFDPDRYWKGPTWININWATIQGLRVYDEIELADDLTERTIQLVQQGGCAEYFSALTGRSFGADAFSWTAALTLDLLHESDPQHEHPHRTTE